MLKKIQDKIKKGAYEDQHKNKQDGHKNKKNKKNKDGKGKGKNKKGDKNIG